MTTYRPCLNVQDGINIVREFGRQMGKQAILIRSCADYTDESEVLVSIEFTFEKGTLVDYQAFFSAETNSLSRFQPTTTLEEMAAFQKILDDTFAEIMG